MNLIARIKRFANAHTHLSVPREALSDGDLEMCECWCPRFDNCHSPLHDCAGFRPMPSVRWDWAWAPMTRDERKAAYERSRAADAG